MNCPLCNNPLKERATPKKVKFLVCTRFPKCPCSATPAIIEAIERLKLEIAQKTEVIRQLRHLHVEVVLKQKEEKPEPIGPMPVSIGGCLAEWAQERAGGRQ